MKIRLLKTIYASDLKSRAVLVMNYLIFRSNSTGACFPAIRTISRECHISVNTVKRALDDLVEAGYVKKDARFLEMKNGAQTSNLYTLCEGMFDAAEIEPEVEPDAAASAEKDNIERESFEEMPLSAPDSPAPKATRPTATAGYEKSYPALFHQTNAHNRGKYFFAETPWAGGQPMMRPP